MMEKRILVIDDEGDFCEFVKESLEKTGNFEVFVSTDGASGIATAETEKPELILLDINMPRMNGAEVADRLLHGENTKDIPIAFITGLLTNDEVKRRSGYIHGFPFISKPLTISELVTHIEAVFEVVKAEQHFIELIER
jgi:CheY-like chemotaxis protein